MTTIPLNLDGYTDLPPGKIANVVTYLELTAPPAAPAPAMPGLTVRHVARPDLAWHRRLVRRIGEDWLWTALLAMPDAEAQAELADPRIELHLLERAGAEIGVAVLDLREPGTVEIVLFGVVPEETGTGAAHLLMGEALARAFRPGVGRVWLHTCSFDHPGAIRFYRRWSFRAFKYGIEVMDDPRLTGLLPASAAPHVPLIDPKAD